MNSSMDNSEQLRRHHERHHNARVAIHAGTATGDWSKFDIIVAEIDGSGEAAGSSADAGAGVGTPDEQDN